MSTALMLCGALWFAPAAAFAQTGGAATPDLTGSQLSQGPMIVEQVHNGFLVAPDFKFTQVDKKSSGLAGGYVGSVFADAFFIGGGAYVLASNTRDRELAYGGLVLQWFGHSSDAVSFGVKTLLGGGSSQTTQTVQILDRGHLTNASVRFRQDFFVAEPEVDARIRLTRHLRLTAGIGYRATGRGRDQFDGGPRPNLSGAVGSLGLQIGGGS
jgi:hypothetical protein